MIDSVLVPPNPEVIPLGTFSGAYSRTLHAFILYIDNL